MSRKHAALQRRVARLAAEWVDPHDELPWAKREIVQNIDVDAIRAENELTISKLDDAIDYTRDIKSGLRDDLLAIEKSVDRMEDKLRSVEVEVRDTIDNAEERFENRRDKLSDDYDQAYAKLRKEIEELEEKLDNKLQKALDNPLSD